MPSAGLAVMPESASEPPHSSARQIASSGAGCAAVRAAAATSRSTSGSTARSVPALPPQPASVNELDAVGPRLAPRRPAPWPNRRGRSARSPRRSRASRSRAARARRARRRSPRRARPVVAHRDRAGMPARDLLGGRARRGVHGQHEHVVAEAPPPVEALIADELHAHMLIARRSRANTREPRVSAAVSAPPSTASVSAHSVIDRGIRAEVEIVARAPRAAARLRRPRSQGRRRSRRERRRAPGRRRSPARPPRPARRAAASPRPAPESAVDAPGSAGAVKAGHEPPAHHASLCTTPRALGERPRREGRGERARVRGLDADHASRDRRRRERLAPRSPRASRLRPRRHGSRTRASRPASGCRRARRAGRARRSRSASDDPCTVSQPRLTTIAAATFGLHASCSKAARVCSPSSPTWLQPC